MYVFYNELKSSSSLSKDHLAKNRFTNLSEYKYNVIPKFFQYLLLIFQRKLKIFFRLSIKQTFNIKYILFFFGNHITNNMLSFKHVFNR